MTEFKNILVPVDFSESSNKSFLIGQCLAERNSACLHVIHVIDPAFYSKVQLSISNFKFMQQTRFANAKEELNKFKFEIPHSNLEIISFITEGVPHKEILKYARQNIVDLIVIASHGWTSLPHMNMGSNADKLMRQAEIPVICIKSDLPLVKKDEINSYPLADKWFV